MGVSGSLRTMGLADLLQWVFHSQKTGTLIIHGLTVEKRVFFENGFIISTTSSDPREYLGQFLVAYGYITEEELRKAMDVQEESQMLLGKILVMIGAITSDEIQRLMRIKAEESLYEIFLWDEAEFTFIDNLLPEIKMVLLKLDPTKIIMDGLRRADEWKRVKEVIPSLKSIPEPIDGKDPGSLEDNQKLILDHCNGKHTVADIGLLTRMREFNTALILFRLKAKGFVTINTPREVIEQERLKQSKLDDLDEGDLEIHRLITRSGMLLRKGQWEEAWETIRRAQSLKPDDLTVEERVEKSQSYILTQLHSKGITPDSTPYLLKPLEETSLTPKEGFIITRINGEWDVKNIINVSPMHAVDAHLVFYSLFQRKIIGFKNADDET